MKTKLMSKRCAKMNETELNLVVGGFFTAYVFPYLQSGNDIICFEQPLTVSISLDPYTAMLNLVKDNMDHLKGSATGRCTSMDEFNKFVKDFNKKNGSQWLKPATYGNVVSTVNLATMDFNMA